MNPLRKLIHLFTSKSLEMMNEQFFQSPEMLDVLRFDVEAYFQRELERLEMPTIELNLKSGDESEIEMERIAWNLDPPDDFEGWQKFKLKTSDLPSTHPCFGKSETEFGEWRQIAKYGFMKRVEKIFEAQKAEAQTVQIGGKLWQTMLEDALSKINFSELENYQNGRVLPIYGRGKPAEAKNEFFANILFLQWAADQMGVRVLPKDEIGNGEQTHKAPVPVKMYLLKAFGFFDLPMFSKLAEGEREEVLAVLLSVTDRTIRKEKSIINSSKPIEKRHKKALEKVSKLLKTWGFEGY